MKNLFIIIDAVTILTNWLWKLPKWFTPLIVNMDLLEKDTHLALQIWQFEHNDSWVYCNGFYMLHFRLSQIISGAYAAYYEKVI